MFDSFFWVHLWQYIFATFWFFLPAMVANMAPVLFKWVPFLNFPVDFNLKFHHKRILGDHKTFRGLLFAVLCAMLVSFFTSDILTGLFLGLGTMIGDLLESFFKRQFDILPGRPWFPFDQVDWAIGAILLSLS